MFRKHIEKKINKQIDLYEKYKINNDSFKYGTLRITNPGYYELEENIIFDPQVSDVFLPTNNKIYPENIYFLGFFAAITIECDYVILDLNGYKIECSQKFFLIQRFFSIIELANTPFVMDQGPTGTFDDNGINCANYVIIKNGTLGTTSHTGIHGNNNNNIIIEYINCIDFEVGGIILNNCTNIIIHHVQIRNSHKEILVNSTFFAFINIIRCIYTNNLFNTKNEYYRTKFIEAYNIYKVIMDNIDNLSKIYNEFDLCSNKYNKIIKNQFDNKTKLPDGSVLYGISITPQGASIKGIGCCLDKKIGNCSNIIIENIHISDLKANITELTTLKIDDKIVRGAFGEIICPDKNNKLLLNLQFTLWSYLINNKTNIKTTLNLDRKYFKKTKLIVNAIMKEKKIDENYKIICGSDIMNHFNKGIIGMRLEKIENIKLNLIKMNNFINIGKETRFQEEHMEYLIDKHNIHIDLPVYIGNSIFGIIGSEYKLIIQNYDFCNMESKTGKIYDICF